WPRDGPGSPSERSALHPLDGGAEGPLAVSDENLASEIDHRDGSSLAVHAAKYSLHLLFRARGRLDVFLRHFHAEGFQKRLGWVAGATPRRAVDDGRNVAIGRQRAACGEGRRGGLGFRSERFEPHFPLGGARFVPGAAGHRLHWVRTIRAL